MGSLSPVAKSTRRGSKSSVVGIGLSMRVRFTGRGLMDRRRQREALEGMFSESLDLSADTERWMSFSTFTFRERPWCVACGEMIRRSWLQVDGRMIEETLGRGHRSDCPYLDVDSYVPKKVGPSQKLARGVMTQIIESHMGKKAIPMVGCIEEGRVYGRWHCHVCSAPRNRKQAEWLEERLLLHADRYGMVNTRKVYGREGLVAYTLKHQSRLTAPGAWMVDRRHKMSGLDGGPALQPRRGNMRGRHVPARRGNKGREPGSGSEIADGSRDGGVDRLRLRLQADGNPVKYEAVSGGWRRD